MSDRFMDERMDPEYWDDHPDVFVKDLADRLGLVEPVTCAVLYNAVVKMVHELAMDRVVEYERKLCIADTHANILASIRDAQNGTDPWDVCNGYNLDEDAWMPIFAALQGKPK